MRIAAESTFYGTGNSGKGKEIGMLSICRVSEWAFECLYERNGKHLLQKSNTHFLLDIHIVERLKRDKDKRRMIRFGRVSQSPWKTILQ